MRIVLVEANQILSRVVEQAWCQDGYSFDGWPMAPTPCRGWGRRSRHGAGAASGHAGPTIAWCPRQLLKKLAGFRFDIAKRQQPEAFQRVAETLRVSRCRRRGRMLPGRAGAAAPIRRD